MINFLVPNNSTVVIHDIKYGFGEISQINIITNFYKQNIQSLTFFVIYNFVKVLYQFLYSRIQKSCQYLFNYSNFNHSRFKQIKLRKTPQDHQQEGSTIGKQAVRVQKPPAPYIGPSCLFFFVPLQCSLFCIISILYF